MHKKPEQDIILFLHGFMGCAEDWTEVIRYLENDYICLTPDLPGHGGNRREHWPEGFFFPHWASEIATLLKNNHVQTCHFVGYSMGGRLALFFALKNPGSVRSLVLESAAPGIEEPAQRAARLDQDMALAERILSRPWAETLDAWYDLPVFAGIKDGPAYKSLLNRRLSNDPDQMAAVLRGTSPGLQPSLWEELPDLKMPVLTLAGERDEKYVQISRMMKKYKPDLKTNVIADAGHNIHFEHPRLFADAVRQFLVAQTEE